MPSGPRAIEARQVTELRWSLVFEDGSDAPVELPTGERLTAGRARDAPIRLPESDQNASRYHAAFEATPIGVEVTDLDSRNGVLVHDMRVRAVTLRPGERVRLGQTLLRVECRAVEVEVPAPAPVPFSQAPMWAMGTVKATPYHCEVCGKDGPVPTIGHEPWWIEIAWICRACADARKTAAASWEEPAPEKVGVFEVLRFLARGGMAAVYEARHPSGMRAALKVMLPQRQLESEGRLRFLKEQRITRSLAHRRIVRCLDVGELPEGKLWVATELLDAGDAESVAGPNTDVANTVTLAADMVEALVYAHGLGIVHRDIKPSNLLLLRDARGRLRGKLSDFGLAKSFRNAGGTIITKDNEIRGSAPFIAPEQLLGFRDVSETADVYSAASTLYYLLTGELPLAIKGSPWAATDAQLCLATLADDRVSLAQRRPDAHPFLVQWVDLLVSRDWERRKHVSAADVLAALRAYPGS